jgi:p-methyltransferase
MDCVVVGFNELDVERDEVGVLLGQLDVADVPATLHNVLRTQLAVEGRFHSYLEALSYVRRIPGDAPLYTVAELPSLGTLYLVNYLRKHGHHAEYVNSFTHERSRLINLLGAGPVSVAITTTFYMMPAPVIDIVEFVRRHNPSVPIIVGGPLVDNYCRAMGREKLGRVFDRMGANYYVWDAQGEATLAALVAALAEGRPVDRVPNTFTREGGSWSMHAREPENNDLDKCAIDWRQFSRDELGSTVSTRTARSCAFKCAFCDYPERAGPLTVAKPATVEQELESLADLGVRRVAFIDDTFNVPVRRFEELCRMMLRRGFGLEWFSYFRCGNARDPALYDLMRDSGCRGVLLGIESGDDSILTKMDKRARTRDYRFGIEQLKRRDIFIHASLVVGFPGETPDSVQHTIDFLNESGPDTFAVNHWYYLHTTPIHTRAETFSLKGVGHNWSHATMNSREAIAAADRMFESITAAWMPVNGLDFWGVPYLLGKGASPRDIVELLRRAKPLTLARRLRAGDGAFADVASEAAFADLCTRLPLADARYRTSWRSS